MLCSHQGSAPAHTLLQRVKEEVNTDSHLDLTTSSNTTTTNTNQPSSVQSLFWSSSDLPNLNATTPDIDATPKTGPHLYLDNLSATSCADLLSINIDSLDPDLSTPSDVPDNNVFAASNNSGCQSSPAMSATSNYNFETPSLHQVSALATPFTTSSPTVGSAGTGEGNSAKTSPSQHDQGWYHASSHDRKLGFDGPAENSFQTPYPHKSTAYQGQQQAQQAHHNDHDYYSGGHGATHPGVSQYLQQRASISGPLMDSAPHAERYESSVAAHAPPRVHGLAAWENASGSARPHTADGMFGQFGVAGPGVPAHDAGLSLTNSASSSRLHTPTAHSAQFDPYHRRMSMPDGGANGKVFSYMASSSAEDGAGINMGSQFGGHYFGGGYSSGASKKRPRRRYDEIERLYPCSWPGCTKSYGTLNHLNAHVAMQKHGPKRSPGEFKDMRKAWRKQKKEEEQQRQSRQGNYNAGSSAGYAAAHDGANTHASNLPLAGPPALSGFGAHAAASSTSTSLPGIGQLPGSMAHLGRYSMSSVSAAPSAPSAPAQAPFPFYSTSATTDSGFHNATAAYSTGSSDTSRISYASSAANQHHSIGAYLAAHRGSI